MLTRTVTLNTKRLTLFLTVISVLFAVLTVLGRSIEKLLGDEAPFFVRTIAQWFDVSSERSAATWYAALLLLACGLELGSIAALKWASQGRYRHHWLGLAVLFVGMSVEEIAGVHEQLSAPIGAFVERSGFLYYSWVLAGLVVVALVAALCFRFWLHLDRRTRWLFLLAALLYVGGSIGLEMLSANLYDARNGPSLRYWFVAALEELGEMLGAVVFLFALLRYLRQEAPNVRWVILFNPAPLTAGQPPQTDA